jgi:hypothetical protein
VEVMIRISGLLVVGDEGGLVFFLIILDALVQYFELLVSLLMTYPRFACLSWTI